MYCTKKVVKMAKGKATRSVLVFVSSCSYPLLHVGFLMRSSICIPGYGNREPQFENCDFDVQMMNANIYINGERIR